MYNGASRWGQAFDHWCLAVFFVWYTWLYKGVTFVFLLSFPLSLPFDWTWDVEYVSVVLLYLDAVVLCYVWKKKKMLIKKKKTNKSKKKKYIYIYIYITALESLFLRGPHTSIEAALVLNQWIRAWTTADACHWLTLVSLLWAHHGIFGDSVMPPQIRS